MTTAPAAEKIHKAAGLTIASALTGGLRDLAVVFALRVSRASDGFFALFLVTQFLYSLAVGGHLITMGKISGLGPAVRSSFFHTRFAPRLRVMAAISTIVVFPIMYGVYDQSLPSSLAIAVFSAAILLCRGAAEFRSYAAISEQLNTAMLAAIWQNLLIIAAALACRVAGARLLAAVVLGVVLGYVAQALHLRQWAPGPRLAASPVDDRPVSWAISGRELLLYGGPALEQLIFRLFPAGTGTIVVFARRIAMTIPTSFAVPFGLKLLAGGSNRRSSRANAPIVVQSAAVLVLYSLMVVQVSVVGLRLLTWIEHAGWNIGRLSDLRPAELLRFTVWSALGAVAWALHGAMSRHQQALGHERRAFITTATGTIIQIAGLLLGAALHSVGLAVGVFSLAWVLASVRDFQSVATWRGMVPDVRRVLVALPAVFVVTAWYVALAPLPGTMMQVGILLVGCLPLVLYGWLWQRLRQSSTHSWI